MLSLDVFAVFFFIPRLQQKMGRPSVGCMRRSKRKNGHWHLRWPKRTKSEQNVRPRPVGVALRIWVLDLGRGGPQEAPPVHPAFQLMHKSHNIVFLDKHVTTRFVSDNTCFTKKIKWENIEAYLAFASFCFLFESYRLGKQVKFDQQRYVAKPNQIPSMVIVVILTLK